MTTLLILTTGQSDLQLAMDGARHELEPKECGVLHDEIKARTWAIVDPPKPKEKKRISALPEGDLTLCTPKLDAVLAWFDSQTEKLPAAALIFETRRSIKTDPRFAGAVIEQRLKDREVLAVFRHAFLEREDLLEDPSTPGESVLRRDIVRTLSSQISAAIARTHPSRVVVATTGGFPAANSVIQELAHLHAGGGQEVISLEVADGTFSQRADVAAEEKYHPASGFRARWHALSLIEKGNLLGAWGAVSHLHGAPGQAWVEVVRWLGDFAASMPIANACDLEVLKHRKMAVRAALRVELALKAGDIPRAVHGTVAFSEAALWDWLLEHFEPDTADRRWLKRRDGAAVPEGKLLRNGGKDDIPRPFEEKKRMDRTDNSVWYWFHESGAGRFAGTYLKSSSMKALVNAVEGVKKLRNDVAHNEPTPALMFSARGKMRDANLWSGNDTFLSQPLVQNVLREMGIAEPENLAIDLLRTVRARLEAIE